MTQLFLCEICAAYIVTYMKHIYELLIKRKYPDGNIQLAIYSTFFKARLKNSYKKDIYETLLESNVIKIWILNACNSRRVLKFTPGKIYKQASQNIDLNMQYTRWVDMRTWGNLFLVYANVVLLWHQPTTNIIYIYWILNVYISCFHK